MKYKLSNHYELTVQKIENGFLVRVNHPDNAGVPSHFFASEMEALEFAAAQLAKVIEELK